MEIKATLQKPYTEEERTNFIIAGYCKTSCPPHWNRW